MDLKLDLHLLVVFCPVQLLSVGRSRAGFGCWLLVWCCAVGTGCGFSLEHLPDFPWVQGTDRTFRYLDGRA